MANTPFQLNTTQIMQNAAVATGNGANLNVAESNVAVLQTSGTFVGTVTYEWSLDGTNWSTATGYTIGGSTGVTTATAAAIVRFNTSGMLLLRARISAYTSGSITVVGNATSGGVQFAATNN